MKEFFSPWSLFAVALFALNNHWLKWEFHNWITGKLSDFMACFFIPLLFSALIGLIWKKGYSKRYWMASTVTIIAFSSVKLFEPASDVMNNLFSMMTGWIGMGPSINRTDPTDLMAFASIPLAYFLIILPLEKETRHVKTDI